uniref:Uncharacterized protein n=1 Tax=Rhipicephalus zambeziensis TaxID=60191 RepID=A0A224YGC7_9ACAR
MRRHHRAHGSRRHRVKLCGFCVSRQRRPSQWRRVRYLTAAREVRTRSGDVLFAKSDHKPMRPHERAVRQAEHMAHARLNRKDPKTEQRTCVRASLRERQAMFPNLVRSCFTHYVRHHGLGHCRHGGSEFPIQHCFAASCMTS